MFNKIDYQNWDRKEIYELFTPCSYYITANLDITRFLAVLKQNGYKFYPSINYILAKVVNAHKEYRFAIEDDCVGYYDEVSPMYTLLRKNNLFTHKTTQYNQDFKKFYGDFLTDAKLAENCDRLYYEPQAKNALPISTTHRLSFTGLAFSAPITGKTCFIPFATIGKYFNQDDKILMPLSVEFHHEVNDGFHSSNFYEYVQAELDNFSV